MKIYPNNIHGKLINIFFMSLIISNAYAEDKVIETKPDLAVEPIADVSPDSTDSKDNAKLDKFLVTGSHIKRIDTEGPAPVLQIDREAIEQSGASSLNQLLSELTLNNGLMLNENRALSNTPGSAAINLRGLGQDATLVLINGRRMSNYPYPLNSTDTFVDLNSIPLAAVERVEVLKDGASAIYGSDALAGVVNIILRQDYDSAEVSASYGVSSEGDADETRINFVKGISSDKSNITFVFDYFKRESFLLSDRSFSATGDQTIAHPTYGVDYTQFDFHPANYIDVATLGGVAFSVSGFFDPNPWVTAVPESERVGGVFSYKRDISTDLTFFTDLLISQVTTEYKATPTSVWGLFDGIIFPAAHPNNPEGVDLYLFWRMTELGSRTDEITTDTYRLVGGFEGVYKDWDWEAAIHQSESDSQLDGRNYVSATALQNAFDSGLLNPFGPNSQAELDAIRTSISRTAETQSQGADAKITGEIAQLDAGPMMLAVGVSYLKEKLTDTPDAATASGDIIGQGSTASEGDRHSVAAFAELNLPLQENVEMQLALRAEDYSDFGSTVNPKVAIKFKPSNTFMLRASAGTAFRAPSLPELYQADTVVFGFLVDTAQCAAAGGTGPACDPIQIPIILSSNPDLDAEESTSYYLGALFEPTKQFSVGLDYWNYDQDNIITNNTQDVIDINDPSNVIRTGPLPTDDIFFVFDSYTNSANRKTDGVDLELRYRWDTTAGQFEVRSLTTKVFSFKEKIRDADPYIDYAGKFQAPDLRSSLSLNWSRNDYAAVITANYIDKYEDSNFDNDGHMVDSYLTYDGQFTYSGFKNMSLVGGINNILDEEPPFSNSSFTGYDSATHNPTGRFYYIRLNHQF